MLPLRFSGLLDAEERHRASPFTFSIPRSDLRHALEPGARVKLLFGASEGDSVSTERMWVEVLEVTDASTGERAGEGRYVGRLANTPVAIADLRPGDHVRFGPEHVAAIWREVPDAPTASQLSIVSWRIWRGDAHPARASRMRAPDPAFSGWILFAADDPMVPPADLAGFEPVSHQDLLRRFRSFDSIEDEAAGTAWRWDEPTLEWRAATEAPP